MAEQSVRFLSALAVNDALLAKLADMPFTDTGTRRICLHESDSSQLHAMLVESAAGTEFPAHYHSDSDEVTVAVKGHMQILIWDKGLGTHPTRVLLGVGEGEAKAAFVPKRVSHATLPVGGDCVYLEVKLGPFDKHALVKVDANDLTGA